MTSHRFTYTIAAWLYAVSFASAQISSEIREKLHPEVHGYATQAFLYSNHNDWNATSSTDGSLAWSEGVVSLTVQPSARIRLGAQVRDYRLGTYGNKFSLDWASAEFKVDERLGFRGGKVKSPLGMLNETQDIDPAHLWILLPQSIYPLATRTTDLSHIGGVVFGTLPLGENLGKVEYRAFGGKRVTPSDVGVAEPAVQAGIGFPGGLHGITSGGSLRWRTPVRGLIAGITESWDSVSAHITFGPAVGTFNIPLLNQSFFFARYERDRLMVAGEYSRFPSVVLFQFTGAPLLFGTRDLRAFYLMSSYKLTPRLSAGGYYSSATNRGNLTTLPHEPNVPKANFEKDLTLSGRFDFNPYLYLKAEQHFLRGTLIGYEAEHNPDQLDKNSRLSLLKLGVSF